MLSYIVIAVVGAAVGWVVPQPAVAAKIMEFITPKIKALLAKTETEAK